MSVKWYVGAILKEPLDVTLRFVAWYLEQGAEQIALYFDDPVDPAADLLKDHPKITVNPCTPEFWRRIGICPDRPFVKRQNRALTHAYNQFQEGWFLNVDSDEFMYFQDRTVAEVLESIDPDVWTVKVLPAEVIQTDTNDVGDHFRCLMERPQIRSVYGSNMHYVAQRSGLVGHNAGKSFTRAGLNGVQMRQHWPVLNDPPGENSTIGREQDAYLLHFFDRGFDSWLAKAGWRASARGFRNMIKAELKQIENSENPREEYLALYRRLHHFDDAQLRRLKDCNAHLYLELGLDDLVKQHFHEAYA